VVHQESIALGDAVEHAAPEGQAVDALELTPRLVPEGGAGHLARVADAWIVEDQRSSSGPARSSSASVTTCVSRAAPVRLLLVPSHSSTS
jgi:hypothetical protein